MEKIPIFDQTHGLTLWENSNFFHFLKRNLCVQESVLFYLEYQQKIFLGLFCPKTNYGKNSNFWPKPWTNPFAKIRLLPLFEKTFLCYRIPCFYLEYQQTIFLGLFSPNTKYGKKIQIFDQNHCKNINFSTFWTSCFYRLEKRFFVLEYRKRHLPGLYYLKKKSWKTRHFWTKTIG